MEFYLCFLNFPLRDGGGYARGISPATLPRFLGYHRPETSSKSAIYIFSMRLPSVKFVPPDAQIVPEISPFSLPGTDIKRFSMAYA